MKNLERGENIPWILEVTVVEGYLMERHDVFDSILPWNYYSVITNNDDLQVIHIDEMMIFLPVRLYKKSRSQLNSFVPLPS